MQSPTSALERSAALQGRVAIVTGAAQGIGAEYARVLAGEGAAVLVSDVADAQPLAQGLVAKGWRAKAVRADVTDPRSVADMVEAAIDAFGRIDILVNNAALFGTLTLKRFEEIDSTEWDRVMAVNVRGIFECTKAVVPHMRANRYGKIINIASGTVFKGTPMMLHYVTSKGAVVAMTRCLARELGDDGIRVNTLAPGLIMSDNVVSNPTWSRPIIDANVASRAIKREALPTDLAGALVFLASDASDFVTGQVLVVDGGSAMH
jgi:NAD(P)-dependent dehydrogenase (short-subunit alcohol dehydrogenase family)